MEERNCCVKNCHRSSHDRNGRRIPHGLTFHCFPAWRTNEGGQISALTKRRRAGWVAAVGRGDLTFSHVPVSMTVCSRHFHCGKPANEMLESDPDWVPSLHMGDSEESRGHTERLLLSKQSERQRQEQRWTTETSRSHVSTPPRTESEAAAAAPARPAVRPWKDIKSLLLSALQRQTDKNKQPGDETRQRPAAVKSTDHSFRDFFRDSLQASLEASSRFRALSARPPSISEEYKVELSVKLPPLREENRASAKSSSSCLNCVKLQRRIVELQEKLSHLTGEQEEAESVLMSNSSPVRPDEALQISETAFTVEKEPIWTEPLSPPEWALHVGVQDRDSDSADKSSPSGSEVLQDVLIEYISSAKPRPPPRFQKAWLTKFPFLRYSPSLNQMWCHVCRLYTDKSQQNLALIRGSSVFKLHNIKQHSRSNYHRENMERHRLS